MQFRWRERTLSEADAVVRLQRELNSLSEPLARLLVLRGVMSHEEARLFFRGSLQDLHDPFLMAGMDVAVERVVRAIEAREPVMIFGDYDVDGVTSTALMVLFLREMQVPVTYHVPDRISEGYGLNTGAVDRAVGAGARLLISLDCGITAHVEAEYACAQGVDLIVCDHHTPEDTLPCALAVLDPKRSDCLYPFKELSGCGVGLKLVQGVLTRLGDTPEKAYQYLDLVALSSASDIVSVVGENRLLMKAGFGVMDERPRPGLVALAKVAGMNLSPCNTGKIVFGIGPRLNAAGRMDQASQAVELLLATSVEAAAPLAARLEEVNEQRRELDKRIMEEAFAAAEARMPRSGLVLYEPEWHPGVIGIVASRVVERYYRPTVMLCRVNGLVKGSARSIDGVNIYSALSRCSHFFEAFGGHDYAAGVTMQEERVPEFIDAFDAAVAAVTSEDLFTPAIHVDALLDLGSLDDRFWAVLKQFGPFGPSNARPVFRATNLSVVGRPRTMGRGAAHLKFAVRPQSAQTGRAYEVVGFNLASQMETITRAQRERAALDLLFTIDENEWNGSRTLQLYAKDFRTS